MNRIRNLDDLHRANIVLAWVLLDHAMTNAQHDELCCLTEAYFPEGPPFEQVIARRAA